MLECRDEQRREAVRIRDDWNGIDFVEVDDSGTVLTVLFLGKAPQGIAKANVSIEGGRTSKGAVAVLSIDVQPEEDPRLDDRLLVHVDRRGDHATYVLRLTGLERIDPRYAAAEFSFMANCPSDLDCAAAPPCPEPVYPQPAIDYLAKDYASFRQLILDRLALVMPEWRDRLVPDLGVTLVELLAYVGDYLSYYQDAVATEAYLATARRRPSVRRHARLVDYVLGEGCNARAFVCIEVANDITLDLRQCWFITALNDPRFASTKVALKADELDSFASGSFEVFEPMDREAPLPLLRARNALRFYSWGDRECCLKAGSVAATLHADERARLRVGDVLVFEEVVGPRTGSPADADPNHRHAVRLTSVTLAKDLLTGQQVLEITWGAADALPFDLCLSTIGPAPTCKFLPHVSVARANVVLVDHGQTVPPEALGEVPTLPSEPCCECEGRPSDVTGVPGRFAPTLQQGPLTFSQRRAADGAAADWMSQDPRRALPSIFLRAQPAGVGGGRWEARADLLSSGADDQHFVVEMEEDGVARLRFGDDELGEQPDAGTRFTAHYRVGNGPRGNVGAKGIAALVHRTSTLANDITRVWNPLPARGGTAPEPMSEAKLNAPQAFRFGPEAMQRAIIADDYARLAERHKALQRAAARLAWTGSWFEASVSVDPLAAVADATPLTREVLSNLEAFRRIGHDLGVRVTEYVPIDLAMTVCAAPEYIRGHVKAALLDAFSDRALPGNRRGFFHPDSMTFGSHLYLSAIIAAAHAVPGVVSVQVTRLQRQHAPSNGEIEAGVLPLGVFETAKLANDPNLPDQGRLVIHVMGGR